MMNFGATRVARRDKPLERKEIKYTAILTDIHQPIITDFEPSEDKPTALTISQFVELLEQQEDYYTPERIASNRYFAREFDQPPQTMEEVRANTKFLITMMRKIFYDGRGWDWQMVRGNSKMPGRYNQIRRIFTNYWVKVVGFQPFGNLLPLLTNALDRSRHVCYFPDDPEYDPQNPLKESIMHRNQNQAVILKAPKGDYADLGHMLCGLDAANYPQPVSPLPTFLFFLKKLGPYIRRNIDAACWVGDIASAAGECLYRYSKQEGVLSINETQELLDKMNPGSDVLGNIDGFVIPLCYEIASKKGMSPSAIFRHFYLSEDGAKYLNNRFRLFCMSVGIEIDPATGKLTNRDAWVKKYFRDTKVGTAFYCLIRGGRLGRFILAASIWFGWCNKVIQPDKYLEIFYDALEPLVEKETSQKYWDLLTPQDLKNIHQRLDWMDKVQPMQPIAGEKQ